MTKQTTPPDDDMEVKIMRPFLSDDGRPAPKRGSIEYNDGIICDGIAQAKRYIARRKSREITPTESNTGARRVIRETEAAVDKIVAEHGEGAFSARHLARIRGTCNALDQDDEKARQKIIRSNRRRRAKREAAEDNDE